MTDRLNIHPKHPQERLLRKAVKALEAGGVIVYPTDSGYALGCQIGDKSALDRIRQLRQLPPDHHFTLMCRDLSEVASYARLSNAVFRLLKAHTPGAYTFILEATRDVPKRLQHPKRKTIGLRIPDNLIALQLMEILEQPMLSTSLILGGEELPLSDAEEIAERLEGRIDLIIDGGPCGRIPTSIVDLTTGVPEILRHGRGDVSALE